MLGVDPATINRDLRDVADATSSPTDAAEQKEENEPAVANATEPPAWFQDDVDPAKLAKTQESRKMTILNVWITPQVGLVATDSLHQALDGAPAESSKIITLPHFPAIISGVGLAQAIQTAAWHVNLSGLSFDEALSRFPEFIALTDVQTARLFRENSTDRADAGTDYVVVGWSRIRDRIIGRKFTQAKFGDHHAVDDIDPNASIPWQSGFVGPRGDTAENMAVLTRKQHCDISGLLGESGGEIIVAAVTRDAVNITKMGKLPAVGQRQ